MSEGVQGAVAFQSNIFNKSNKSSTNRGAISFYLDSGATDHMINDSNLFCRSKLLEKRIVIGIVKAGENLTATHIGDIDCLHLLNGQTKITCIITDILHTYS